MRLVGFLFLIFTFLAGITVATIEYAMINVVIFLALALGVVKFLRPRFGANGVVYGMAGAFFASFLWPYLMIFGSSRECVGDDCLKYEVTIPPRSQSVS